MFKGFFDSLQSNERLRDLSPSELCQFQSDATKRDAYLILDALQGYIQNKAGTFSSLKTVYSSCKQFFLRNRSPLPNDKFVIKPSRAPTKDNLSLQMVKNLVSVADLEMKAFYLTVFGGFLDQERFQLFNKTYAQSLVTHLKERGLDEPFKIEFTGRKSSRNKTRFYSYLGHDSLQAWQQYFERVRGFPEAGEPILLDRNKKSISKPSIRAKHHRLLKRLRFITPEKNILVRYGTGIHNFRDCVVTTLHPHRDKGFDKDTIEFFMGHLTDPNNYDKFFRDEPFVRAQYLKMAPYLNLITGTTIQQDKDIESRIKRLEEELKEAFAKREKADEEQYEEWARTHPKEISEILKGAGGESL
jgi:hypothetical protein